MREIKFRAKDKDNGEWRYGFYVQHLKTTLSSLCPSKEAWEKEKKENTENYIIFDGFSDWNFPKPCYQADVDGDTVCQYTGLKDSKGKEIYEGDIIKDLDGEIRSIEWCAKEACYKGGDISNITGKFTECIWSDEIIKTEIIGNIFDNPELLEVRDE